MTSVHPREESVQAPLEDHASKLVEPFRDFANAQSASGWMLVFAALLALVIANSIWSSTYYELLHLQFGITLGNARYQMSLQHCVNDGLMAMFFFLLGLELKREMLVGRLRDIRHSASILFAAVGGMLIPVWLFIMLVDNDPLRKGWAIPAATDTAFALMILVLLGKRVPEAARAFLVGFAITDDLGAILIIAVAYTQEFNGLLLLPTLISISGLALLNLTGVRSGLPYLMVGFLLWLSCTQLGLHGTIAGVIVALSAPVRPEIARRTFVTTLKKRLRKFENRYERESKSILEQPRQQEIAQEVSEVAAKATVPLSRWEARLERPMSFAILPLFAFLNAGVDVSPTAMSNVFTSELSAAIFVGLFVGKPAGILVGLWIGTKTKLAELPESLSWRYLIGIGFLGSIGFTMSLLIAALSFGVNPDLLAVAKTGVIATSFVAGLVGYAWLRWAC